MWRVSEREARALAAVLSGQRRAVTLSRLRGLERDPPRRASKAIYRRWTARPDRGPEGPVREAPPRSFSVTAPTIDPEEGARPVKRESHET